MIRLKLLYLAVLLTLPFTAHADTVGPVTMNGGPLGDGTFFEEYSIVGYQANLGVFATPTNPFSETIAFSFDIAPGWTMDSIQISGPELDVGVIPPFPQPAPAVAGAEYLAILTLCPTTGACVTGSTSDGFTGGNASLPPLPPAAVVGPGVGVLQIYAATVGLALAPDGTSNGAVNIHLIQTSPAPEPASLALFGTGALGLLAAGKRKFRRKR